MLQRSVLSFKDISTDNLGRGAEHNTKRNTALQRWLHKGRNYAVVWRATIFCSNFPFNFQHCCMGFEQSTAFFDKESLNRVQKSKGNALQESIRVFFLIQGSEGSSITAQVCLQAQQYNATLAYKQQSARSAFWLCAQAVATWASGQDVPTSSENDQHKPFSGPYT